MKNLEIACPPNAWPASLDGCVAVGITNARGSQALWLLFQVKAGSVISVAGTLSTGDKTPPLVKECGPVILASGPRQIWMLITNDKEEFYGEVANGKLHIEGDFREFGRFTRHLIRLTEHTDLWSQIDDILERVQ